MGEGKGGLLILFILGVVAVQIVKGLVLNAPKTAQVF